MMLLIMMLATSFTGGYIITGLFAPSFGWNYVIIFSVVILIVLLFVYEEGRKYLND